MQEYSVSYNHYKNAQEVTKMNSILIGKRIQYARELAGLTQAEASRKFGFKDRQTLAAIEAGIRKMDARELSTACALFSQPLEFFIDPLKLINEGAFTWHASVARKESLVKNLNQTAGSYLALYRALSKELQCKTLSLEPRLVLEGAGSAEQVAECVEELADSWELGGTPAERLESAITAKLPFLVLTVKLPKGVLSGACRLSGFSGIFLSTELSWEARPVELARQCLHLLTWEQLPPPEWVLDSTEAKGKGTSAHIERLTREFIHETLLPREQMEQAWSVRTDEKLKSFVVTLARRFSLPASMICQRLLALDLPAKNEANKMRNIRFAKEPCGRPRLYSKDFIERVHQGLCRGLISERRLLDILGLYREELKELFADYSLSSSFLL